MAEPTVKVKVILDDSELTAAVGKIASQLKNAFANIKIDNNVIRTLSNLEKVAQSAKRSMNDFRKEVNSVKDNLRNLATENTRIARALDKATKEIEKTKKAQTTVTTPIQRLQKGFLDAQKGIFAFNNSMFALQVVVNIARDAFNALWSTMREGAVVNTTAQAFDRVSASILKVPNLLEDLRIVSRGTINDFALMTQTMSLVQGAAPNLAQALGQAAPAILEIARASAILNPALGSAEQNYARLALGIRRSSVRILDDIGLVIRLQDAYDAYAEKIGKTVTQLTAQEKQFALLEATLREGQNLIDALGDSTTSQVDAFQQLEASWTNLMNSMKGSFAESVLPIIRTLSGDFRQIMQGIVRDLQIAPQEMGNFDPIIGSLEELIDTLEEAAEATGAVADDAPFLDRAYNTFFGGTLTQASEAKKNLEAFNLALEELIRIGGQVSTSGEEFLDFLSEVEKLTGEDFDRAPLFEAIVKGLAESTNSVEEFQNALFEAFTIAEFEQMLREGTLGPAAGIEELIFFATELRNRLREVAEEREIRAYFDSLRGEIEETALTLDELEAAMKVWGQIDFGKGLPEDVAALSVALGKLSVSEAEAAVQAYNLEESLTALVGAGKAFTDLSSTEQAAALFALSQGFAVSAREALAWVDAMIAAGVPLEPFREQMAQIIQEISNLGEASKEVTAFTDALEFGAQAVSQNVADLLVALGMMTQAEADAAVATFNLTESFNTLSQSSEFLSLSTQEVLVAWSLLNDGTALTADAAIEMAQAMIAAGDGSAEAAAAALLAAVAFTNVAESMQLAANATADAAQEIFKTKGSAGELVAEFIKLAQSAGASATQLLEVAAASGLLTDAEVAAIAASTGLAQEQERLFAAVAAGTMTYGQAVQALLAYAAAADKTAASLGGLANAQKGFGTFVSELNAQLGGGGGGGGGLIDSLATFRDTFIETIQGIGDAQAELDKAVSEGKSQEEIDELTKKLGEASGATRNWKKELFDLTIQSGASVEQIIALGVATGILNEKQAQAAFRAAAAAAAIEKIAEAYVAGRISAEDAAAAVGDVQKQIAAGGDIDLSQFGIDVGQLASQTAQAGSAAGGAAKQTKTWRDELLNLADSEDITAQKALELARASGQFSEEQIKSALAADAMGKAVESLGEDIADLSIDNIVSQLEGFEQAISGISADELAVLLDLGIQFDLSPAELTEALGLALGGLSLTEAVDVVVKARFKLEPTGADFGEFDPQDLMRESGADAPWVEDPATGDAETTIAINIDADNTAASAAIAAVGSDLATLAEGDYVPTIDADTSQADEAIDAVTSRLTVLDSATYDASVSADTSAADQALSDLIERASGMTITIPVTLDIPDIPGGSSGGTPPPDDSASRGARVLPGDVLLVGDSGRPDPSELFVSDAYLDSGGRNSLGANAPRIIGQNGPMFFEADAAGFVLPYVPASFAERLALAESIRIRDNAGHPVGGGGFGRLEDYERMEDIIDAIQRGAQWTIQDFLDFGWFWLEQIPGYRIPGQDRPPRNHGFSEGGYTGETGGEVHPHEFVFNPAATSNLGVSTLQALHEAAMGTSGLAEALGLLPPSMFGLPVTTFDSSNTEREVSRTENNELHVHVANPKDARSFLRKEIGAIA